MFLRPLEILSDKLCFTLTRLLCCPERCACYFVHDFSVAVQRLTPSFNHFISEHVLSLSVSEGQGCF